MLRTVSGRVWTSRECAGAGGEQSLLARSEAASRAAGPAAPRKAVLQRRAPGAPRATRPGLAVLRFSNPALPNQFQGWVITGGHYDVDCRLEDPDGIVLYKEMKKQYDSFTFTASRNGTYKFCFSNEFSTFTHKTVYFDFQVGEDPPLFPSENRVTALTQMESACVSIHEALKSVIDYQTHFRLREAQGRSRAEDLNTRVAYWSVGEAIILLVVSVGQVFLLKSFFSDKRTTTTRVGSSSCAAQSLKRNELTRVCLGRKRDVNRISSSLLDVFVIMGSANAKAALSPDSSKKAKNMSTGQRDSKQVHELCGLSAEIREPASRSPEAGSSNENIESIFYKFVILHAENDVDEAIRIQNLLQNKFCIKPGIIFAEMPCGKHILENLSDAVNGSAWTIILLTESFLKGPWCEFQSYTCLANALNKEHKYNTVIPVRPLNNPLPRKKTPFALQAINALEEDSPAFANQVERIFQESIYRQQQEIWRRERMKLEHL
ncbi:PREDICTED: uncharacterized protein LOC104573711 [Tinamus guttatus]|nr:PREDICTED: uncharacterized protein LOC104573711 [Tinamus guttatus]